MEVRTQEQNNNQEQRDLLLRTVVRDGCCPFQERPSERGPKLRWASVKVREEVVGSNPGQVIPKSEKMVPTAFPLDTQNSGFEFN